MERTLRTVFIDWRDEIVEMKRARRKYIQGRVDATIRACIYDGSDGIPQITWERISDKNGRHIGNVLKFYATDLDVIKIKKLLDNKLYNKIISVVEYAKE